jgi:hypothetical protein
MLSAIVFDKQEKADRKIKTIWHGGQEFQMPKHGQAISNKLVVIPKLRMHQSHMQHLTHYGSI